MSAISGARLHGVQRRFPFAGQPPAETRPFADFLGICTVCGAREGLSRGLRAHAPVEIQYPNEDFRVRWSRESAEARRWRLVALARQCSVLADGTLAAA